MPYEIKRKGRVVETHEKMDAAIRAFWILTAHALGCGHVADYELDTRCEPNPLQAPRRSEVPDWVAGILAQHGMLAEEPNVERT